MSTTKSAPPAGLTFYSRFVLFVLVLPLLFIAGIQLFILSSRTETYFAWTFAAPISAAFLGAGYWAAIPHAFMGSRAKAWTYVRTSMPAALTATGLLTITTFLHIDKFHFSSPLLITRFVTWVWVIVYIVVPPILAIAWIIQSRLPDAKVQGQNPLPAWMRSGFSFLAVFALLTGLSIFFAPGAMSAVWAWPVPPLAARAISAWLTAFGVACAALTFENDLKHGAGTCSSLFAFCALQLIVVARYSTAMEWSRPMTIGYILFLLLGLLIPGANLLTSRRIVD